MDIAGLKIANAQTACLHQVALMKFLTDVVFRIVFCITNFFVEGLYYNMDCALFQIFDRMLHTCMYFFI